MAAMPTSRVLRLLGPPAAQARAGDPAAARDKYPASGLGWAARSTTRTYGIVPSTDAGLLEPRQRRADVERRELAIRTQPRSDTMCVRTGRRQLLVRARPNATPPAFEPAGKERSDGLLHRNRSLPAVGLVAHGASCSTALQHQPSSARRASWWRRLAALPTRGRRSPSSACRSVSLRCRHCVHLALLHHRPFCMALKRR